jgi:AcrR family transcriptional regulator
MAPPPLRSDALRNRQRLLAAAREVFDEQGVTAPLDEIARRAGTGNATMYRHFANRRELALAVYADEVTSLCDHGLALLEAPDAGEALFTWLRAFMRHVATKRELATVENPDPGDAGSELFARWHAQMRGTVAALVERAQQVGAVRPDLDAVDLLLVTSGIAFTGADSGRAEHLLDLVRRGTGHQDGG